MEALNLKKRFKHKKNYFTIRQVFLKDVKIEYIRFLNSEFILHPNFDVDCQKIYVKKKLESKDEILFGLFLMKNLTYTSNVKFNLSKKSATVGILRTNKKIKNVGYIFLNKLVELLNKNMNINIFCAGVALNNFNSVKVFQKSGFKIKKTKKYYKCILKINEN